MNNYSRHFIFFALLMPGHLLLGSKYWCPKGHFNLNQHNFFQKLARDVKPKYALETGFCTGRSASSLLEAAQLKTFISIDINLDYIKPEGRIFAQLLQKDFPEFKLIEGDSKVVLTNDFFAENFPHGIDWVTVDGDHSYAGCLHDLEVSSAYVSEHGIIIIDDYRSSGPDGVSIPHVTSAVDYFCKHHKEFKITVWNHRGKGFAILTRCETQDTIINRVTSSSD